jgi:hypothetical protein
MLNISIEDIRSCLFGARDIWGRYDHKTEIVQTRIWTEVICHIRGPDILFTL